MILNVGKCLIETTPCTDGAIPGTPSWKALHTPKDGTTKLTQTAGQTTDYLEEGGDIVDTRTAKSTGTLEWDEYVKKGETPDFTDDNGIVAGEHAFRVTSTEDPDVPSILITRASLSVTVSYSTTDGILRHHVARILKPATGATVIVNTTK